METTPTNGSSGIQLRQETLASVLACYRGVSWRERLHVGLRARMMKLWSLEGEVPRRGRILDLGAGQGLVALTLALIGPEREVIGIEREERKVGAAKTAAVGLANLSFRQGNILELSETDVFDVVLLVDVLYLWREAEKRRILQNAHDILRQRGLLLVHEVTTEPRLKYAFAVFQEWVALHILRTTAAAELHYISREENESLLRSCGFEVESIPVHQGMPYPHHLFRCCRV